MSNKLPSHPQWSPAYYDAAYYGKGSRGGFNSYDYATDEQQGQLNTKFKICGWVPHKSALFIGCARGFEVAYWLSKDRDASGVDVSKWAIENQIEQAKNRCALYDGHSLAPRPDDSVDLIACFDVLPHLPNGMREQLCAEMVRVAKNGIIWRQIIKNWRNLNAKVDGIDGAVFVYQRFETWDRLFTESGKFKLLWAKIHEQYEVTAVYRRT